MFFLPYDFDGSTGEWVEYAWESIKLPAREDKIDMSKYRWVDVNKNKIQDKGEFFSLDEISRCKDRLADPENPTAEEIKTEGIKAAQIKSSDFSQFNAEIIGSFNKDRTLYSGTLWINLKGEVWDNDYTHHGRNNLVNRYTTWDSENSLYYGQGGNCFINLDGLDNNLDGLADKVKGFDDILESQVKYVNSVHGQCFDFKYLCLDSTRDLHFGNLETGRNGRSSLILPRWDFKIAGVGNAGQSAAFELVQMQGGKKSSTDMKNIIENKDKNSLCFKISVKDASMPSQSDVYIEWPMTKTRLDSINSTGDGALLKSKPPGSSMEQLFIGPEKANVNYGIQNVEDSSLGPICQGMLRRRSNGSYCYAYQVLDTIIKDPDVCITSVFPESIQSPIPLRYELVMKKDLSGVDSILFYPHNIDAVWTTDNDPALWREGPDKFNKEDDDQDLFTDEDASGFLFSRRTSYNRDDFRLHNQVRLWEGYETEKENFDSANNVFFVSHTNIEDNPNIDIDEWEIHIRHLDGSVNNDLEIKRVKAAGFDASGDNDLKDYFQIKLRDNVFTPKKILEIKGIADGVYNIYYRNKEGWNKIPILKKVQNTDPLSKKERTVGFWDVSGLHGNHTVVLEVIHGKEKRRYQSTRIVQIGQVVNSDFSTVVCSPNARAELTLPAGAFPKDMDNVVSITPRRLDELKLEEIPSIDPLGPVIEIRPSPVDFSAIKPEITMNFSYSEAKSNNWLNDNFNIFALDGNGRLSLVKNSVVSYYSVDSAGSKFALLDCRSSFNEYGQETGLGIMEVRGVISHWSDYVVLKRRPRIWYVNPNNAPGKTGASWPDALNSLKKAMEFAACGDTIRLAMGRYSETCTLKAQVHLCGGYE
ncbi:MAG: hypothetical protein AB1633_07965, partial [Elusimicrobiota bacterium]